jgi:crotonobetaine/carnitine-CoA ligase
MLAVVLSDGSSLDAAAVAAHADRVLPRFARPRYIEIVPALPKTPTQKVRKQELRTRAVTSSTWERERQQPREE